MKSQVTIKIIYEDNHLLVVEKPPNIPSQRDDSNDPDMLTLLKDDLRLRHNKPGNVFLGLVHRLDRPVGGVMVFAKTSKSASRLSDQIREREFNKVYYAVINGKPLKKEDTLVHYLLKDVKTNIVKSVEPGLPDAKEAILDYEVLNSQDKLSLVRVILHTGRPHQIRVQLASIGHPLFGDQKYGFLQNNNEQIALWSYEIRFKHPTRDENMVFSSTPPGSFPWNIFKEF
ncbi:MAG: RluA family pseudouridine synthase [Bacillota bacterium]|nr:RluA family pseudouridine synthase [Bacillota bacterium]